VDGKVVEGACMPKVSVIMASYNHEKYVSQAVQSVLDQTFQDFEIVITDDASQDHTAAEIGKFTDRRIRFFQLPSNRGQFVATNHCLRRAQGEYVAILNSDDFFLPQKLEEQVRFLDTHPDVAAVFTQARIVDDQGRRVRDRKTFVSRNMTRYERLNRFFYRGPRLCHPSVLVRRQCHEVVGGYDERYAQMADYDLWIRICLRYDIHILPEELTAFRWLPENTNMSGRRPDSIKRRCWENRRLLENYLAIQDRDFFVRVFPEARQQASEAPAGLLPFVLAQLSLRAKARPQIHQAFALETIFRLLADPATAEALRQRFGFDYRDFIQLTGQHDVFNAFAVRQGRVRRPGRVRPWYEKMVRGLRELRPNRRRSCR